MSASHSDGAAAAGGGVSAGPLGAACSGASAPPATVASSSTPCSSPAPFSASSPNGTSYALHTASVARPTLAEIRINKRLRRHVKRELFGNPRRDTLVRIVERRLRELGSVPRREHIAQDMQLGQLGAVRGVQQPQQRLPDRVLRLRPVLDRRRTYSAPAAQTARAASRSTARAARAAQCARPP